MVKIGTNTHYQLKMQKLIGLQRVSKTDKREIIARYPESEKKAFMRALKEQLKFVLDLAKKHGIEMRPDCGTLLGIYRDNHMLPWDFDNDVSCKLQDLTLPFIIELFERNLLKPRKGHYYFDANDLISGFYDDTKFFEPKILKVVSDKKFFDNQIPVMTDIFTWIPKDGRLYSYLSNNLHMVHAESTIYPLKSYHTNIGDVLVPSMTALYLENMYGIDWKIPNPGHKDRISKVNGLESRKRNGQIMQNLVTDEVIVRPIDTDKIHTIK